MQMNHHSGTTTCRSANIWHMSHNMYLIIGITSKQRNIQLYVIRTTEKHFYNITINYKRAIHKFICLRLKLNINYIPKDWLYKIQVSRRTQANNKRLTKWDTQVHTATTPAICLSRSTPSTVPQGHPLDPLILQPKHQYLHGCGVNHR